MKKKAAAAYREPLFDRIFKPEIITLSNGHSVKRPRSRVPLISLTAAPSVPTASGVFQSKTLMKSSGIKTEWASSPHRTWSV